MVVYYGIITTTSTGVHVSMMVQMLTRQRGLIITNHVLNMMNDMVMLAQTSARGSLDATRFHSCCIATIASGLKLDPAEQGGHAPEEQEDGRSRPETGSAQRPP